MSPNYQVNENISIEINAIAGPNDVTLLIELLLIMMLTPQFRHIVLKVPKGFCAEYFVKIMETCNGIKAHIAGNQRKSFVTGQKISLTRLVAPKPPCEGGVGADKKNLNRGHAIIVP